MTAPEPEMRSIASLAADQDIRLPEMSRGKLDAQTLARYFDDLLACAQVFDVLVKGAPERYADTKSFPLALARQLFDDGLVRGLQIRYRYDGDEWWDTLMRADAEVILVRVRQDWDADE